VVTESVSLDVSRLRLSDESACWTLASGRPSSSMARSRGDSNSSRCAREHCLLRPVRASSSGQRSQRRTGPGSGPPGPPPSRSISSYERSTPPIRAFQGEPLTSRNYRRLSAAIESGGALIFALRGGLSDVRPASSPMAPFTITDHYEGSSGQATWTGHSIVDGPDLRAFLSGPVRDRLLDSEGIGEFSRDLDGLAGAGLASETVEAVLAATEHARAPWEVGEATAEALLEEYRGLVWPWNKERDKLTPRASLPGADLVGLISRGEGDAVLAIGEVKSSGDVATPPGVMSGRSGMAHQLQRFEDDPALQGTVLRWLHARCKGSAFWPQYQAAVSRYLSSGGRDFVLFGLLMRDTDPHALDLEARGTTLGGGATAPTVYELSAWHLPFPIEDWTSLTDGEEGE
jgi:hypothetical protein